jgi:hypothetical protein
MQAAMPLLAASSQLMSVRQAVTAAAVCFLTSRLLTRRLLLFKPHKRLFNSSIALSQELVARAVASRVKIVFGDHTVHNAIGCGDEKKVRTEQLDTNNSKQIASCVAFI